MRNSITILTLWVLLAVPIHEAMGQVGPEALKLCRELAFSTEEDFVTRGPEPPDGNPIISDGDLLGPGCAICARNEDLLKIFDVQQDLGLDAVHIVDADSYLVVFSTELDSPNRGQFTAGDLLVTNGAVIPNAALLGRFNILRADLGLDAVQLVGDPDQIKAFLDFAGTKSRDYWLTDLTLLATELGRYGIDVLFSTEGTGPSPEKPVFLDGDLLSVATGTVIAANGDLLPPSVPAGIPTRGVDFGLDAAAAYSLAPSLQNRFSTEILYRGEAAFTDGDVLSQGVGVFLENKDLIKCFEPRADFLGLDAFYQVPEADVAQSLWAGVNASAASVKTAPHLKPTALQPQGAAGTALSFNLEPCRELAFSTEEDFVTRGPEPPDGNPIISDGDLLGKGCVICARNRDLLQSFDVLLDLGLDAADVVFVDNNLVAFSTELDSPNIGQFTAGDLLATNGAVIPNVALLHAFGIEYDMGLDALLFVGETERIVAFLDDARSISRQEWLAKPAALAEMLLEAGIDIWFSTEGTGPSPENPIFLDGDLLSAATGTVVASNDELLPSAVPAGIPTRGIDFGLDAVSGTRDRRLETIHFSTELLFTGETAFTDGDVLRRGDGVVLGNEELIACFEPVAGFLGLDAFHQVEFAPPCRGDFDCDRDVDGSDLAVFAADFGRTDCAFPPPCEGDFDGDGDVDGSDLAVFAADFGRTDCPPCR